MLSIAADPGMPDSSERVIPQVSVEGCRGCSSPSCCCCWGRALYCRRRCQFAWVWCAWQARDARLVHLHVFLPPMYLQAGQVWFPDSALKTAQAIEEFGLEVRSLYFCSAPCLLPVWVHHECITTPRTWCNAALLLCMASHSRGLL